MNTSINFNISFLLISNNKFTIQLRRNNYHYKHLNVPVVSNASEKNNYIYSISVATKYSKKYLVRVLLNFYKKVFSTSTLRGGFQKYLVRVLNTL